MTSSNSPLPHIFAWTALALGITAVVAFGAWTALAPTAKPVPVATPTSFVSPEIADDLRRAWALLGANAQTLEQLAKDPERLERAAKLIEGVLKQDPEIAEAHRLKGILALATGDLDAARASLEHSLELDPDRLPALLVLGAVLVEQEDHEAAEVVFRHAAETHPRSTAALHNLGQTLWMLGRQDDALEVYRRKVEIQQGLMVEASGAEPAASAAETSNDP